MGAEVQLYAENLGYQSSLLEYPADLARSRTLVVRLAPDPIALERITVLADRFKRRTRRAAVSSAAFGQEELQRAATYDMATFLRYRAGVVTFPCGGRRWSTTCVFARGGRVPMAVYIDGAPALGGFERLRLYRPDEIYHVEVYSRGRSVHLFTKNFVAFHSLNTGPLPIF